MVSSYREFFSYLLFCENVEFHQMGGVCIEGDQSASSRFIGAVQARLFRRGYVLL